MAEAHRRRKSDNRRGFLSGAVVGLLGGSLAAVASEPAAGQPQDSARHKGLVPKGAPAADSGYTPGIVARGERVVFVSGQGPDDLNAPMETQIRQTFRLIGAVLAEASATFKDVVMICTRSASITVIIS